MDCHLIAVEVGVERRTHERMQLNGLAFNQYRFESLDTQSVQRRRPVQHDRMLTNHLFQDIPDFGALALYQSLGGLDGCRITATLKLREDKWLEQLQR